MLLKFAYQDFIEDRKFKNTTPKTIENYTVMLSDFIEYCNENGVVNVEDITYPLVKSHLQECQKRGNKPNTINTKLLRIRAFLNYLVEEVEVIKKNPAKKVKRQSVDVQIDVFTDNQINQMLGYYRRIKQRDKSYYAYRDYMIIVTLLGTGARRSEISALTWNDVDLINQSVSLIGKNRIKETIPITEKLAKELAAYKVFCSQYFSELSDYVFASRFNKQMSTNAISLMFENLAHVMNFKNVRVSSHTFRHTYCHRLAISGMPTFAIQKLMRHKNVSVTVGYVAMWGNELRDQNDKYNPLNNLEF
ncbi:tyrosine-type recombinase/integrase [Virgibacillus natechei]